MRNFLKSRLCDCGNLANADTDVNFVYRSSPSRNKPVPVNVPDSRPSLSSVTLRDTSVSVSRPPRKSQLPSVLLLSSPSCPLSQLEEVTGVPTWVLLTLSQPRRVESVDPSLLE